VSACVILLRYRQTEEDLVKAKEDNLTVYEASMWKQMFNQTNMKIPTQSSANVTAWATFSIGICSFVFCGVIANGRGIIAEGSTGGILLVFLVCFVTVILSLLLISIHRQPQSVTFVAFKVPMVPFVPTLSILLNVYLMVSMDAATWAKFGVWMLLGMNNNLKLNGFLHSEKKGNMTKRFVKRENMDNINQYRTKALT